MKKILSTDPSSRPYSSFRSAAISSLFTRNHRKMRRDRAIDRHVLIGRQVSEDFSPGGQIIENKIFFIYSLYGDVPQCGHGCGWSSTVPISANGPRAVRAHVPRMHGEKGIVVHIFLQIAVARLSKPRFAPFSFSRDATLSTVPMFVPWRLGTRHFHPPI